MHVDLSKGTGFMYLLLYLPQQFTDIQLIAFCSACATNKSVKTVLNIFLTFMLAVEICSQQLTA